MHTLQVTGLDCSNLGTGFCVAVISKIRHDFQPMGHQLI